MASVHLEDVYVDFPIYGAQRSLRSTIFKRATGGIIERSGKRGDRVVVRALNDISFRLQDGDRLGLIGHNGSGKSTLLKVLAGIYQPVSGRITVEGRVTPLLDMMPGLDPEDTGYENLVTAGLLLGMSREQVEEKIPEIEEFSELGEYLSLPVRTYSAGMTLRLGFSLVTALEPGILVMDEGFSTGDLHFTERAVKRMDDFIGRSRIIVLATHSEEMIKTMCNKVALLEGGQIREIGPAEDVIDEYHLFVHGSRRSKSAAPVRLCDGEAAPNAAGSSDASARAAPPPGCTIAPGVSLRWSEGAEPASFISQPSFWEAIQRSDTGEGSQQIGMGEFLSERHHNYYGRPWVLGRFYFDHLKSRGLEPRHRVLDLGCGAGRVGIHLIPYLERGRYFGVDAHLRSIMAFACYEAFIHDLGAREPQLMYSARFDLASFGIKFDVVIDFYVTRHLDVEVAQLAYKRVAAATSEGARVFMCHEPVIGISGMEQLGFSLARVEDVSYPLLAANPEPVEVVDKWHEFARTA